LLLVLGLASPIQAVKANIKKYQETG